MDLTGFGFTPTESKAYEVLVRSGPLTGYALARQLSIARANAYQALRGLVAKGAVTVAASDGPERYRPLHPSALLARLVEQQARRLDRLEAELSQMPASGAPALVDLSGERALIDLALRTAARTKGPLWCLAPGRLLLALVPAWHKRASGGEKTALWACDDAPADLGIRLVGTVAASQMTPYFAAPPVLLATLEAGIAGLADSGGFRGHWTSHPSLVAAIRLAILKLTETEAVRRG